MVKNPTESLLQQVLDPAVVRQLRVRLEAVRVERANKMRMAQARVLQLEEDIARVALLSRAVTELFLKKGLFTSASSPSSWSPPTSSTARSTSGWTRRSRCRRGAAATGHARRAKRAPAKAKAQKPKQAR